MWRKAQAAHAAGRFLLSRIFLRSATSACKSTLLSEMKRSKVNSSYRRYQGQILSFMSQFVQLMFPQGGQLFPGLVSVMGWRG